MIYDTTASERQGAGHALYLAHHRDQRYASAIAVIRDTAKRELTRLLDAAEARDYDPPAPMETVVALEDIIATCDEPMLADKEDVAAADAAALVESFANDRTIRGFGILPVGIGPDTCSANEWLSWWEAEHRDGRA